MKDRQLGRRRVSNQLSSGNQSRDHIGRAIRFLGEIWTTENGYGFIGTKDGKIGKWREHPIRLRSAAREIWRVLKLHPREDFDLYFCPNTFSKPIRKKEFAQSTRWGWCDIDGANPKAFWPRPSIVLRTSPLRYQGLWYWDKNVPPSRAERYSHALTYRYGGDPGGWSITKYLRLPRTYNHKPKYDCPLVTILRRELEPICERPEIIKGLRLIDSSGTEIKNSKSLMDPTRHKMMEVYFKYREKLHPKTKALMTCKSMLESDRSKQIYMIVADLHRSGASRDEIAACLWVSPYFLSKYGRNLVKLDQEVSRITKKLG